MTLVTDASPETTTWRDRLERWRKRLDRFGLRWQARLEGMQVDRSFPWIVAVLFWVVLASLALARSRELSQGEALAVPMQAVWLIGEGFTPEVSILGYNLLWDQASFLFYPIALATSVLPTATTLLVVQSGVLAVAVVPLWRLGRQVVRLRFGATAAVVLAYMLYPAVHAVNLAGFHPEVFALPALIGAVVAGKRGHSFRYWLAIVLVLASHADLGLVVAGLGILWLFDGRRRLAAATSAMGLAYFFTMLLLVQPVFEGGAYPHVAAFSSYGESNPFDVAWGMLGSPVQVFEDLFSSENFARFITLLAPVLFLPAVAPRYLLPVVPAYAFYIVADVPAGDLAEAQQTVPVTAFVFVATTFALARTGRILVERVNVDRRVIAALVFTSVVFFIGDAPSSPYQDPWSWGRRTDADIARQEAADRVPDDAVVRASPRLLPLLTERPGLFLLDTTGTYADDAPEQASARVNYILFDTAEASGWTGLELEQFELRLEVVFGWTKIFDRNGIQVYRLPNAVVAEPEPISDG